eukprot:414513-Pelagomonas_calceolata.AAC.3
MVWLLHEVLELLVLLLLLLCPGSPGWVYRVLTLRWHGGRGQHERHHQAARQLRSGLPGIARKGHLAPITV